MVTPYKTTNVGKKEQVADMFNNIAGRYDFLNHLLSLGIDKLWRKKAIRLLAPHKPKNLLDIATGTGDFAIAAAQMKPKIEKIIGVDISKGMVAVGQEKIIKKHLNGQVELTYGDSENLQFEDQSFDAITVAFGVRNFENLKMGLTEMHRVLGPNGRTAIIEFSQPERFPMRQLYFMYFTHILPRIGKWISKDSRAYTYLPESVREFPFGQAFADILKECGFSKVKVIPLTMGIASIYLAEK